MKKKVIIGVILLIIIVIIILIKSNNHKKEVGLDEIPTYKADLICSFSGSDTYEDMVEEYSIKAYLSLKDNYVTKAILVSVSNGGALYQNQDYLRDYNAVEGISASSNIKGNSLVTEVIYDYENIDLGEVKDKLGYLLIDDSIFNKTESLPVTLEEYKEYQLKDYICN